MKLDKNFKVLDKNLNKKIKVKDVVFGDSNFLTIAGPCSIESYEMLDEIAKTLKKAGVKLLRGGAFKLRTSPYSFQGLELEGLEILYEVGKKYNLITVSEITDQKYLKYYLKYVDIIMVGTRNMFNYELLKELGKINKPIILKRDQAATIKEWLLAAEYIISNGNTKVILCERGIKTFSDVTRYTFDIGSCLVLKDLTNLPVIVDPSHATGISKYVIPLTIASKSIGCDGAIIEVHNNPKKALSDNKQQLDFRQFNKLMEKL